MYVSTPAGAAPPALRNGHGEGGETTVSAGQSRIRRHVNPLFSPHKQFLLGTIRFYNYLYDKILYFSNKKHTSIMKKTCFILLCLTAILSSCGSGGGNLTEQIEYLPFRTEKGGNWGLISTDGKVLFEDEFEHTPTVATNGRFMVKNADDMWEIFTADEKPKQVGEAFKEIGIFVEDVTPAVRPGQCVALVNTDGEDVVKLDKLEGKTVMSVTNFSEGIATFTNEDNLCGAIDTDGKVVVKAEYAELFPCSDGKMLGITKKQQDLIDNGEREKAKISILDKKGQAIGELPLGKFTDMGQLFKDGVLAATTGEGSERRTGLIDEKGEWVVKPSAKTKSIQDIKGKKFIYYDGDNYGLMDFEGEVLIRAKYRMLTFAADGLLMARKEGSGDNQCLLIDEKGETVGDEKFHDFELPFLKDGYAIAELERHEYAFVDKKGKVMKIKTDIYDIDWNTADSRVESDFVDIDAVVKAMGLTKDGMDGLTFASTAEEIANHIIRTEGSDEQAKPENYTYTIGKNYTKRIGRVSISCNVACTEHLATYAMDANGQYGYRFSDAKVAQFSVNAGKYNSFDKNLKALSDKVRTAVKQLGTVKSENDRLLEVKTATGCTYRAYFDENDGVSVEIFPNDWNEEQEPDAYADEFRN